MHKLKKNARRKRALFCRSAIRAARLSQHKNQTRMYFFTAIYPALLIIKEDDKCADGNFFHGEFFVHQASSSKPL